MLKRHFAHLCFTNLLLDACSSLAPARGVGVSSTWRGEKRCLLSLHSTLMVRTAAWNLPIPSTRMLGGKYHAMRRYHGISPVFTVHYQDLEYCARNSEKQAAVSF